MQGWRCCDMARGSELQDVITRDSAPWRSHAPRLGSRMTTTRCRESDRGIGL